MPISEIITRLDRIIDLLEAIKAQGEPKAQSITVTDSGIPSHFKLIPHENKMPIEALSPDYIRQMNEIKP